MKNIALAAAVVAVAFGSCPAFARDIITPGQLQIVAPGGFWDKTLKEMTSKEGQVLLKGLCTYYGIPCPKKEWLETIGDISSSERHFTNSVVTRSAGNEWNGIWDPPAGYEICALVEGEYVVTEGVSFSLAAWKGGNERPGLGFYANVPEYKSDGPERMNLTFAALWVPAGEAENDDRCVKGTGVVMFQVAEGSRIK